MNVLVPGVERLLWRRSAITGRDNFPANGTDLSGGEKVVHRRDWPKWAALSPTPKFTGVHLDPPRLTKNHYSFVIFACHTTPFSLIRRYANRFSS
jgi:hypothetical protein